MSIKYQCFYCERVFPADQSIDGYDQGYRVGFLCPKCGSNIQAGLLAEHKITAEHIKWIFIMFVLFLPTLFTSYSEIPVHVFGHSIELNTILFVLWLLFVIILFIIKPSLFKATTILTAPVNKI